jgi:hypothetical protein
MEVTNDAGTSKSGVLDKEKLEKISACSHGQS